MMRTSMCPYSLPEPGRRSLLPSPFSFSPSSSTSSLIFQHVEVLVQRDVTGQLVTSIHYVPDRFRLVASTVRVILTTHISSGFRRSGLRMGGSWQNKAPSTRLP